MAESAKKGGGWSGAADDIARLADRLPPAERGFMIENIRRKAGGQMASEVAEAMRKRAGGGPTTAGGGGLSKEPMVKTPMLGGQSFEMLEDAMKALAGEIGGSIERRRAPLAFPKVYYQAGDKKVGFDVIRHPIFKEFREAADAK